MNKLIENYNNSLEALSEYFGIDNFGEYILQECAEDYWQIESDYVSFGTSADNLQYEQEFRQISRKEELTAVLLESDYGGDAYWCIFYTKNEIKDE